MLSFPLRFNTDFLKLRFFGYIYPVLLRYSDKTVMHLKRTKQCPECGFSDPHLVRAHHRAVCAHTVGPTVCTLQDSVRAHCRKPQVLESEQQGVGTTPHTHPKGRALKHLGRLGTALQENRPQPRPWPPTCLMSM